MFLDYDESDQKPAFVLSPPPCGRYWGSVIPVKLKCVHSPPGWVSGLYKAVIYYAGAPPPPRGASHLTCTSLKLSYPMYQPDRPFGKQLQQGRSWRRKQGATGRLFNSGPAGDTPPPLTALPLSNLKALSLTVFSASSKTTPLRQSRCSEPRRALRSSAYSR